MMIMNMKHQQKNQQQKLAPAPKQKDKAKSLGSKATIANKHTMVKMTTMMRTGMRIGDPGRMMRRVVVTM